MMVRIIILFKLPLQTYSSKFTGRMYAVDNMMREEENAGFNPALNTHFSVARIRESQLASFSFDLTYNNRL